MNEKKVYYISDIVKASESYEQNTLDKIESIGKAAIFGVAAGLTIWLPFAPMIYPDMGLVDQVKSMICGVGIPAVTVPFTIINIIKAVRYGKEARENSKFIRKNRGDITDEEIDEYREYIEDMRKNHMCLEMKK